VDGPAIMIAAAAILLPRDASAERGCHLSVRPSVCLSVRDV